MKEKKGSVGELVYQQPLNSTTMLIFLKVKMHCTVQYYQLRFICDIPTQGKEAAKKMNFSKYERIRNSIPSTQGKYSNLNMLCLTCLFVEGIFLMNIVQFYSLALW